MNETARNVALKERFPSIDDPVQAINFALDELHDDTGRYDFLCTWREGAWSEIQMAYPEFLERIAAQAA